MIDWLLTSEIVRNWTIAGSAILAVGTFFLSIKEKREANKISRYKAYVRLEDNFNQDKEFQKFVDLLDEDGEELKSMSTASKYRYMGFVEEVAIAVQNELISKNLAFYMFGYYAIRARESDNFSSLDNGSIEYRSLYWNVFNSFVNDMKELEEKIDNTKPLKVSV